MGEVKRLLKIEEPMGDENLIAYLIRLTELNYYDQVGWIQRYAGINVTGSYPVFYDNGQDLNKLVVITGQSEVTLRSLLYEKKCLSHQSIECSFLGFTVPRRILNLRRPRVCTSCLRESHYLHKVWDLNIVTACAVHGCLLLDLCPKCNRPITWHRNRISICKCSENGSFDWRSVTTQAVTEQELQLTRQVHKLCGYELPEEMQSPISPSNPLYHLDLGQFFKVIFFIAGALKGVSGTTGPKLSSTLPNSEMHLLLNRALEITDDWPNNFYKFLGCIKANLKNYGSGRGASEEFGIFYQTLTNSLTATCFDFLRVAFEDYLRTKWDGQYIPGRHRSLLGLHASNLYMAKYTAARQLHIEACRLKQLIKYGQLKVIERKANGRTVNFVEYSSLIEYKQKLDHTIGIDGIIDLLGLSGNSISDLIREGILIPFSGPTVDEGKLWKVSREEVTRLINEIEGRVSSSNNRCCKLVSFDVAVRLVTTIGVGVSKFIQLIKEREIIPYCQARSKRALFLKLKFDKSQIKELVRQHKNSLKGDLLSVEEAAIRLGINDETVYVIRDAGILKFKKSKVPNCRGIFTCAVGIASFKERYATAVELAARVNTNTNKLVELLAKIKIYPVVGPFTKKGCQHIFRREDLEHKEIDLHRLLEADRISSSLRSSHVNLTIEQVARILGRTEESVRHLVENGLLVPVNPRSREYTGEVFNGHSVSRYQRLCDGRDDVVSGLVAARILNLSINQLHHNIVRTGRLKPVSINKGCRYKFFLRAEVEYLASSKKLMVVKGASR